MKNSFLEILSCVIISWSGKHLDWLESLLGTMDGQALVRGILFLCFSQHSFRPFLLVFFVKIILHTLCPVSCQLIFTFPWQHRNIDPCCFSSLVSFVWEKKSNLEKLPRPRPRRQSECLFGGSGRGQRKKWKIKVGKEEVGVPTQLHFHKQVRWGTCLARRGEARIAQDHRIGNRFLLSWIDSEWFSWWSVPPIRPSKRNFLF